MSGAPRGVLSPTAWSKHVAEMGRGTPFDVVVVGGGVVGAGAALDAASRGLRVALIDAQDWAAGTSGRSSQLAHGGLRYLRRLELGLVREALLERNRMLANAPHLVRATPFLFPLRRRIVDRAVIGGALSLYGWLARLSHSELDGQRRLSKAEALALVPGLAPSSLVGAIAYTDAQVDDARFVLDLVRTAVARGARVANRARVVGFERERSTVRALRVQLTETGAEITIPTRSVVLAGGVWNHDLEELAGVERPTMLRPSKGVHLVIDREKIALKTALVVPTPTSVLFVLPFGRHWLVGTTDTAWAEPLSRPAAHAGDIEYLLGELNSILLKPLARADVASVYAGLRPLLDDVDEETTKLSREHAVARPLEGLVTVSGGKFTTYRVMAADAIDAAVATAQLSAPRSTTSSLRLVGAEGYDRLQSQVEALALRSGLEQGEIARLLQRYGAHIEEVIEQLLASRSARLEITGAPGYLRAEILHSVSHEGARHLEDVLLRRTRIARETDDRGVHAANEIAALMAGSLGWDDRAIRREVETYRSFVHASLEAETCGDDLAAARAVASARPNLPLP